MWWTTPCGDRSSSLMLMVSVLEVSGHCTWWWSLFVSLDLTPDYDRWHLDFLLKALTFSPIRTFCFMITIGTGLFYSHYYCIWCVCSYFWTFILLLLITDILFNAALLSIVYTFIGVSDTIGVGSFLYSYIHLFTFIYIYLSDLFYLEYYLSIIPILFTLWVVHKSSHSLRYHMNYSCLLVVSTCSFLFYYFFHLPRCQGYSRTYCTQTHNVQQRYLYHCSVCSTYTPVENGLEGTW